MRVLKFIVERKIIVGLLAVLIVAIGSYAVMKTDKELMPAIEFDGAFIEINAGDLSAIEVERTITSPLEQKIQAVDGVEQINSTTSIGRGNFNIEFEDGKGDDLFKEVEAVLASSTAEIEEIEDIQSGRIGTTANYEFFMDISEGDMEKITAFATDVLEPRLEDLPEVSDVSLSGLLENEVSIIFDREKVTTHGLDISEVITSIQQAGEEATLGELTGDAESPSLRWSSGLESMADVENLPIQTASGFIELSDLAEVSIEPLANSSVVWKNGTKDFVFVQVGRGSDVTQLELADAVRTEIQNIRDEGLVEGFQLTEMVAQADYVQESINGVTTNILIGGMIALVILMLFLRNLRATFIIGLSIPTSILLTFLSMWVFDYSFNMLSLIALGLGIGMMVDASIVILESIYRKKEQGLQNLVAVLEGTKEVASAVFASILTTIVVFMPIGMIGGEVGRFVIILSVVVTITLISSVVVSFTLIPALADKLLKLRNSKKVKKQGKIERNYHQFISWIVQKRRRSLAVLIVFFSIFAGSLAFVNKIPMTIMPDVYNRYNELMIQVETGLSTGEKEELVAKVNERLNSIPDVEANYMMDNGNMFYTIVNMTKGEAITREQEEVNQDIFSFLRALKDEGYPVESVSSAMTGGGGYPVQVTIQGEDFEEMKKLAVAFTDELEKVDGMVEISHSMERTSPEEIVQLNKEAIEKAGLTPPQIKQFIEQAFLNMPVGELAAEDETLPLMAKWNDVTTEKEQLLESAILTKEGEQPLSDFVALKSVENPNEITHLDGERYLTVSADIEGRDLGSINRDVQQIIDDFDIPAGFQIELAGDLEEQQQLMSEMLIVLVIAIFLVYLVMAAQFNHLGHPLIVMSVIPMTVVGVIAGLLLTQRELSMISGMGLLMLIGIVLNNAILLIDRTNQLRREGNSVETALSAAGRDRIRPIFMTTLTTVGGMLPLALATGTSSSYQAPMATVIISGLLFATCITLVLIPAVYRLFTKNVKEQEIKQNTENTIVNEEVI